MHYIKTVRQHQHTLKYYSLNVSRQDLVVEYIPGQFMVNSSSCHEYQIWECIGENLVTEQRNY